MPEFDALVSYLNGWPWSSQEKDAGRYSGCGQGKRRMLGDKVAVVNQRLGPEKGKEAFRDAKLNA